jgi:L-ascorbate metabolism protein UlaG (beta-lactamase superfamily)
MNAAITHISTACVLLEIGPVRILTDPVFDTDVHKYGFGLGLSATRRLGPYLPMDKLPPLNAVLLSHAHHGDNLDDLGKKIVLEKASKIISHPSARKILGDTVTALRTWEKTTIEGTDEAGNRFTVTVTGTPACHGPVWLSFLWPELRHVTGFVLEWKGQKNGALYISGDTIFFSGIRRIAEEMKAANKCIGTAIFHLGGVHFWPPFPSCIRATFTAKAAVEAACVLQPSAIIPIHYEQSVWSHFKQDVPTYQREFAKAGLANRFKWLPKGEAITVDI